MRVSNSHLDLRQDRQTKTMSPEEYIIMLFLSISYCGQQEYKHSSTTKPETDWKRASLPVVLGVYSLTYFPVQRNLKCSN